MQKNYQEEIEELKESQCRTCKQKTCKTCMIQEWITSLQIKEETDKKGGKL